MSPVKSQKAQKSTEKKNARFQATSIEATTANQPTIRKQVILHKGASTQIGGGGAGVVTSPGFGTADYPDNIDIAHVFQSPPGSGIRIKLTVSSTTTAASIFSFAWQHS